jgi:hypothetical protein
MATASDKMVEVGIVLQGSGALGACECGALNALLELMDELESQGFTFGNHIRQDRVSADRINDLVTTIETLATFVPTALDADLRDRVDRACAFKVVRFVDIDMQDSGARPGPQSRSDDQDGLRDFSPATVRDRREAGHDIARSRLLPVFEGCGLVSATEIRRPAAPARS